MNLPSYKYEYEEVETIHPYWEVVKSIVVIFDLKNNTHIERINLKKKVPVYDWHINLRTSIEYDQVKYLDTQLSLFCAYYKNKLPDYLLKEEATKLADNIWKKSNGKALTNLGVAHSINQAIANKDTYELKPNKTIRFIKNPYYVGEETSVNQILGEEKRTDTKELIMEYLMDYDYNKGKLTYSKCAKDLEVSERTIKRYIPADIELIDLYMTVSLLSKK